MEVGAEDGDTDGTSVGVADGVRVGAEDGDIEGSVDGDSVIISSKHSPHDSRQFCEIVFFLQYFAFFLVLAAATVLQSAIFFFSLNVYVGSSAQQVPQVSGQKSSVFPLLHFFKRFSILEILETFAHVFFPLAPKPSSLSTQVVLAPTIAKPEASNGPIISTTPELTTVL